MNDSSTQKKISTPVS